MEQKIYFMGSQKSGADINIVQPISFLDDKYMYISEICDLIHDIDEL